MSDAKTQAADYLARGVEHYGAGRPEQALEDWQRALELDPENREAREYLRYVSKKMGAPGSPSADSVDAEPDEQKTRPEPVKAATMMGLPLPPTPSSSPGFQADVPIDDASYETAGGETMMGFADLELTPPTRRQWDGTDGQERDGALTDSPTNSRQAIADFELTSVPSPSQEGMDQPPAGVELPAEEISLDDDQDSHHPPPAIDLGDLLTAGESAEVTLDRGNAASVGASIADLALDADEQTREYAGGMPLEIDFSSEPEEEVALRDDISASVEEATVHGGSPDDAIRRRVSSLIDKAIEEQAAGQLERAVMAASMAVKEAPSSVVAQKLLHERESELIKVFVEFLGDLSKTPELAKSLTSLSTGIDSRDAFLLTRIDGVLSFADIVDISGMKSVSAYRALCRFILDGIIRA